MAGLPLEVAVYVLKNIWTNRLSVKFSVEVLPKRKGESKIYIRIHVCYLHLPANLRTTS